ncbi:hypothetical protein ACS127_16230 [Amphibacillus sp. Q70]|uniref:hypothetical protein n=1 Tax=Amphibacillus sp. Q70 TaxID=3453416 RepID=UPI003F84A57F
MSIQKIESYLGISIMSLLLLSLLGIPRVLLHDFSLIEEGSFINHLFVFVPMVIWIGFIVWKDVKRPFLSLVVVGLFYGIFLAIGHQILWNVAFDTPIQLGGNLSGLPQGISTSIIRIYAILSSVTTGIVVGMVLGIMTSFIYFLKRISLK